VPTVRPLLTLGNGKLGQAIHSWSLPAKVTCPGSTSLCRRHCYAAQNRYRYPAVIERLRWNFEQSQKKDFVLRMVKEIRRKGCIIIRIHVSGDFYSQEYAQRWLAIMQQCSRPRYFFYTRSFAVAGIGEVIVEMANLKCCRVWYSIDRELPAPDVLPERVKLAYLQTEVGEVPSSTNLIFRIRPMRKTHIPLLLVCPSERPEGREKEVTCGHCRKCFR
jgi:hypothetical protein